MQPGDGSGSEMTHTATTGTDANNLKLQTYKIDTILSHDTSVVWFRRMKAAARALGCYSALTNTATASAHAKLQANWLVTMNLPDSYTYLLDAHEDVQDLWTALVDEFAGTSFLRKADLYQQLSTLRPKHESLDSFLNRALDLRTSFKSAEIADESIISAFLLVALRDNDIYKDWAIQQLQKETPDDLPKLVHSLRTTFRHQLQDTLSAPVAHANQTSAPNSCTYCNKTGHTILSCFKLRADQAKFDERKSSKKVNSDPKKGNKDKKQANQVKAFVASAFNTKCCPDNFYLDSCSTHHMVNNKQHLSDFKPSKSVCCFADSDQRAEVCGTGTLTLQNHDGEPIILRNVLYVPSFKSNLISAPQADLAGLFHRGGGGQMDVVDASGNVYLTSHLDNGMYRVKCSLASQPSHNKTPRAISSGQPDAELVHRRFGHIGYSTLAKLAASNNVLNLPPPEALKSKKKERKVCGPCVEGRQKRIHFAPTSSKEASPYTKLHIDIAEFGTKSYGGNRYFAVLVDDCTNFKWVCTTATKSDIANWLKEKLDWFRSQGHHVHYVRFDRDAVFMSTDITNYFHQHNIEAQPTSGYTPQENGHAERAIGVLKEITQSLLSDSGMKQQHWGDALWHAAYLLNITNSTGGKTPWEQIKGDKPDASHLHIWGCKCWAFVPKEKRAVRTKKSEECRFLGIAWPNIKSYKLLTATGVIKLSRHVQFDESARPFCELTHSFHDHMEEIEPVLEAAVVPGQEMRAENSTVDNAPAQEDNTEDVADHEEQPSPHDDTLPATSPTTTPIVRTSNRTNKGVPATKPYDRHLHGLPSAKMTASFQSVGFLQNPQL